MGWGGIFRRDAQLSSVALLSQLQIFLMGHVLLLPSTALVPQGKVGNSTRTDPRSSSILNPELREVALPSLSGCELCCHLWMSEHHQHSRPSTPSTLLISLSPNSLPVSLQPLLPSCATLSPPACCHLLSPAPQLPWQPTPPCQHLPVPISQGSLLSPLTISSSMPGPSPQSQQETHRHSQEVGVLFSHYILPCPHLL